MCMCTCVHVCVWPHEHLCACTCMYICMHAYIRYSTPATSLDSRNAGAAWCRTRCRQSVSPHRSRRRRGPSRRPRARPVYAYVHMGICVYAYLCLYMYVEEGHHVGHVRALCMHICICAYVCMHISRARPVRKGGREGRRELSSHLGGREGGREGKEGERDGSRVGGSSLILPMSGGEL